MATWSKVLTRTLLVAILAIAAWHFFLKPKLMSDKGFLEIAQAPIWSDLQGIEFQNRSSKTLKTPALIKGAVDAGKYDVLGVAGKSKSNPFVWIVLNADADINGIYAMPPNEDFTIQCDYLRSLESKERINSKVQQVLLSRCIEMPRESVREGPKGF